MATHFKLIAFTSAAALSLSVARAEDGDDTLRYYLSRSSVIVAGKITSGPDVAAFGIGERRYSFSLEVVNRLKGDSPEILNVGLSRPEVGREDRLVWLKKGGQVILFLRERDDIKGLREADPWFSVQPASRVMERSLLRLADDKHGEGGDGDETLRRYIAKSSLIISGKISGDPLPRAKGRTIHQHFRVLVEKVVAGDPQGEIEVDLVQLDAEPSPLLRNDRRVILFLKEADDFIETGGWVGADPWFGVQQYNSLMVRALERLAKEQRATCNDYAARFRGGFF